MLYLSGFELYSRWVPLAEVDRREMISSRKVKTFGCVERKVSQAYN